MTEVDALRRRLAAVLPQHAARWLEEAREAVRAEEPAIDLLFPAVGRRCGRRPLPGGPGGWSIDDAARVLLLDTLPSGRVGVLSRLYRHGDAAERRGVLRALGPLDEADGLGPGAVPLVEDAIRTNDTRLIGAALHGGYAARHLDAAAFRQAVLKCVFTGIPLGEVTGLADRAEPELGRMLADHVRERLAAGREIPADLWPVLDATGVPRPTWGEPT
ncbi:EboA domain-containing protein [Spirillospora sp. CA-294931]|uniref:EboA domain-containing protein n=1 Tax=Spirillospora sp. CA-294931 TaxID=3240042 RepID=UPI003D90EEFB